MSNGTILYYGGFQLPDKSASANRVVSNGKLFSLLGYRVIFLGCRHDATFFGVEKITGQENMLEEAHPDSNLQWLKWMLYAKNLIDTAETIDDLKYIFLYNTPYTVVLAARKYCKKRGIRLVYDCTEWTEVTSGSFLKRFIKRLDLHSVKCRMPKRVDGIITISSTMDRQYSGCHTLRLPPLVDIEDMIWHQSSMPRGDGFEFCFAGQIDGNKDDTGLLIQAFADVNRPNSLLRIIGVTESEFLSYYPQKEELLSQMEGKILFMGRLSHEQTLRYVQNSDCCVLVRESTERTNAGFPTKFAEYFTCGIPVIASAISDIADYSCSRLMLLHENTSSSVQAAILKIVDQHGENVVQKRQIATEFDYRNYRVQAEEWMKNL